MNARPEHALANGEGPRQAAHNDTPGRSPESDSNRQYTCLGCNQHLDSFTMECPNCGGRQFKTTVSGHTTSTAPGPNLFEPILARFNPYIPR